MQEVILLKFGEITLKGLNRSKFEDILSRNIKRRLEGCGLNRLTKAQSTLTIEPLGENFDFEAAVEAMKKVFGLSSVTRAAVVEKEMDAVREAAASYLRETLSAAKTFKVEAKRSDKKFPLTSPQICEDVGGFLLSKYPGLTVDVHKPDAVVFVEIRDYGAFIHAAPEHGAGGMPVSSNGKACLLISGGIDSPVAGYMMAKRGIELEAVHFASPPYTSELARRKVLDLLKIVTQYSGRIHCHIVPFTKIQEQIKKSCPEDLFTVIMRRMMMKIANRVAERRNCLALVTGESVGQVASQTMEAIACTEAASGIPVFRPLVAMDKEEIVAIARRIGTFETSILPYEDCCTVFTPKHPRTRPMLKFVEAGEAAFDFTPLIQEAFENIENVIIE